MGKTQGPRVPSALSEMFLSEVTFLLSFCDSFILQDGRPIRGTDTHFQFFLSLQRPQHTLFCGDVASSHKCIKNSVLKHISDFFLLENKVLRVMDVVKEAVKVAERQVTERDDGR